MPGFFSTEGFTGKHKNLHSAYMTQCSQNENKKDLQVETCKSLISCKFCGVADGARTHDNRNHNPSLYLEIP